MSNTKNVNIQLRRDVEKENRIIEFLEDKPAKFMMMEAMEMYMNAYNQMKEGRLVPGTVAVPEASGSVEEVPEEKAPKSLRFQQLADLNK